MPSTTNYGWSLFLAQSNLKYIKASISQHIWSIKFRAKNMSKFGLDVFIYIVRIEDIEDEAV